MLNISRKLCDVFSPFYYDVTVNIPNFPKWIHIEPTNYCNAKCYFCANRTLKRKFGYMDSQIFQKAIDEISLYGIDHLSLHLLGEPLLHQDIFNMVAYAKSKGNIRQIDFSTNGALLTDDNIERVIASGLDLIAVDMDGATAETYENARRGLKFETTVRNLKHLIEAVGRSGKKRPLILIQAIQTPQIQNEMELFRQQWEPIVTGKEYVIVQSKRYEWFSGAKPDDVSSTADWGIPSPFYVRLPCRLLEYQLNICWNGDVTHCCLDANGILNIGTFPNQSLEDIWQGEKARQLRNLVRHGKHAQIPPCNDCIWGTAKRFFSWNEPWNESLKRWSTQASAKLSTAMGKKANRTRA